jgi:UDP-GlcNAc:undecaprenyl-phosphate/decaprenyl-phosphate GlcNAc-1-phosphate transferase
MEFILPALIAFLVTALCVPPTIKLAKKYGLIDNPKLRPHPAHVQDRIVPRAGGLPIFIGILVAILFFVPLDKHILGILIGGAILVITGLLDDRKRDFSPYPRLLLQFLAAGVVVVSGVGITFITNPFGGILRLDSVVYTVNFLGNHNIILIADLFAFFWIVGMMNMINWAKGVDGQMPGIVAISALTIGLLSVKLFLGGDPHQLGIAILSFITVGAAVGFLIFNWYPAKIFPGFSGSTLLGFMIAVLSILSGAKLATALLVLLIPATDGVYTIIRRLATGKMPFFADKKHLHHVLLEKGLSHKQISCFYIVTCAILGLLATNLTSSGKLFTLITAAVVIVAIILWLNFFGNYSKQPDPDNG